jgi:uncharacterized RDD family membrane protein YckC
VPHYQIDIYSMELHQNTTAVSPFKGFWIRLVAFILDGIIISIAVVLTFLVLVSTASNLFGEGAAVGTVVLLFILSFFGLLLYKPLMEASEYQGTFGKYYLGMKIVDSQGERITMTASFIRTLAYLAQTAIPLLSLITSFLLLMIGFTEYKQGVHDIAAKTYVVSKYWQGPVPLQDGFGA